MLILVLIKCNTRPGTPLARFLFDMYDVDKNGHITEVDFICAMSFLIKASKRDKLERKKQYDVVRLLVHHLTCTIS